MFPLMILAEIPAMYPKVIMRMKGRLMPWAEPAFIFLITAIGHERPKQMSIAVSSN